MKKPNPYESPAETSASKGASFPQQVKGLRLTRFVEKFGMFYFHWTGINVVGALQLCLGIILFTVVVENGVPGARLGWFLAALLLMLPGMSDLAWRSFLSSEETSGRFFLVWGGGSFVYIPIWILLGAVPILIVVLATVFRTAK